MHSLISIEGLPAIGKSSLLAHLSKNYSKSFIEVRSEPIQDWTNDLGDGVLDLFYADPSNLLNFCELQQSVFDSLYVRDSKPLTSRITLTERALGHASFNVFMRLRRLSNRQYHRLFDAYRRNITGQRLNAIIYLRSPSVEFSMDRIRDRGRPCEMDITPDYIRQCHELHEEWLIEWKRDFWLSGYQVPLYVVEMGAAPSLEKLTCDIAKICDNIFCRKNLPDYISLTETYVPCC